MAKSIETLDAEHQKAKRDREKAIANYKKHQYDDEASAYHADMRAAEAKVDATWTRLWNAVEASSAWTWSPRGRPIKATTTKRNSGHRRDAR